MVQPLQIKNGRLYNFIFSETYPQRLPRHVTLWTLRFLFLCFIIWFNDYYKLMNVSEKIIHIVIFNGIHLGLEIFFCYSIIYFLIPKYFYAKRYFLFSIFILVLCIIDLSISFYVIYHMFNFKNQLEGKLFNIFWGDALNFLTMGPSSICILFLIVKTAKAHYLENEKKKIIIKENALAELQLLRAQVHPHFLFNTLNNIYFFILTNTTKAQGLVKKLEKILQYMITECEQPIVPLSKEINMINDYFELEKVRYDDLDIELKITGDYANKMIAPLLMIPFIENSFKHGTSKMLREPWIKLFIQADEDVLHFTLANSRPSDKIVNANGGIGLSNVHKRLKLLYPSNHLLVIEPTINTFTVNMQIPLEHENKAIEKTDTSIYNS